MAEFFTIHKLPDIILLIKAKLVPEAHKRDTNSTMDIISIRQFNFIKFNTLLNLSTGTDHVIIESQHNNNLLLQFPVEVLN